MSVVDALRMDNQFDTMSHEAVGFTNDNLSHMNGTAIETIFKCSLVSPDILSTPALVERYSFLVEFAKDFFLLVMLVWLISYVIQLVDEDQFGRYASMIPFIKRSLIAMTAIIAGMQFYTMLMELNLELSILFGGSDSLVDSISGPFIGDMGCIMTGISAIMLVYMAVFYVMRYILLIVGLGLWVFGWLFWIFGAGHSSITHKLETLGLFLLQFVVVNIFLGAAMCFVFWMARLVVYIGTDYGSIGSYGSYIMGLCFCILAGGVPIVALIFLLLGPRFVENKLIGMVA